MEHIDINEHIEKLEENPIISPVHLEFFQTLIAAVEICFDIPAHVLLREGKFGNGHIYAVRKQSIALFNEQFDVKEKYIGLFFKKDRATIIHTLAQHRAFMDAKNELDYKRDFEKLRLFIQGDTSAVMVFDKDQYTKQEVIELFQFNGIKCPLVPKEFKNPPS